ncbi:hypothetical protein [Kitasatospora sp. NPDC002965]|uniref:hypothetical protein n=1 Tax=Kitasatospora sp. NPDC002965 TaxID=3154775 RepID=UPI0033BAD0D2
MGPIGRARASLTAVETLLRIQADEVEATAADLDLLRHWPGWGPLAPALAPDRTGTWAEIGEQLQQILPRQAYRQAEQATPTAYYTPGGIIDASWSALRELGVPTERVLDALEPGCGQGAFIGRTPADVDVRWLGVERDPTTAGIAALLHPNAKILNARLQDAALRSNSVDLVLGNVPYGNFPVSDLTAPKAVTDSIHNYFIWRSMQALRPGGIAILLTSRYTMDSASEDARRAIGKHADLVGAIRLPNGALAEGGTNVLADILVLRRRDHDEPDYGSWMGTSRVPGVPDQICNDYFIQHPEHVLGTFVQGRAAQYGHTLQVQAPDSQDFDAALQAAFSDIATAARAKGWGWNVAGEAEQFTADNMPFPVRADGKREGSFHLVGDVPHEVIEGALTAVPRAGKELPKLIRLRDATLALMAAETDHDRPDAELEPLRAEVNRLYDIYVTAHGPINRYTLHEGAVDEETGLPAISRRHPRLGGFRRDPDVVAVLALESFDDETQTATKAALLSRRVNRRIERPTSAETPEEALSLCLNEHNRVDEPTIARLLGITAEQVPEALGDLVFADPDGGELLTADDYLSGAVVDKLERAQLAVARGEEQFERHVAALTEVQPEPLAPEEIRAKLGAPWIPVEDVADFAEDVLGRRVDITHVARSATWSVDQPMTLPTAATSEWGTDRVNGYQLLDLALNGQAPTVYDNVPLPGGGERRVRNDSATLLAEGKQSDLARRFSSWVWENPDRADRLAGDYNRLFNSTVLRKHDGRHLTIDGIDPEFTPYSHQWDMVQRVLSAEEGSLCPYPVGAGKTATMFMVALKLKQLGLVNKPMIVVPNHLLEEIARDGKKVFPTANILMAGKRDLADARSRMLFATRCATNDVDAVVMTHNSFGRLGVHPVSEAKYLEDLADAYRQALGDVEEDGESRRIKEIAKQVERFDARASDLRSKASDAGVSFENLGVDFIQVDEAHYFKNLALPATTEGMSLGKPSKRATDLDLKIQVTRERTGRDNVTCLYTGTPISNSIREMFVFQHYLQPKRLAKIGLEMPDAWAANFIHFESRPEVGVDGVSFRLKRRPVEYANADEALALFQEIAELRPRESFDIKRPERDDQTVAIEPTANLQSYVAGISDRIDDIQAGKVKPKDDNMLKVITDGRKAALDLELVGLAPDGPGKAGAIVREVLKEYHETKDLKLPGDADDVAGGFQLVFCDLGTPGKERGSQVYGKIRAGLIDGVDGLEGIPRERIRFIHDYNSDLAKTQLFSDCRAGKVSVLLASTDKAGVGTNVQTRGVALHHADPPHRPADWEQREGRFDRPGNLMIDIGRPVKFFRYISENSFDSYMFQGLERKQRPVTQIMSGRKVGRVIEEIDPVGAGFAEAKAIASGNPLLLELAEATGKLTQLHARADGHRQAQSRMRRRVEVLTSEIGEAQETAITAVALAGAVAGATDELWRTADGGVIEADDVPAALAAVAQAAGTVQRPGTGFTWRGLEVSFTLLRRQMGRDLVYEPYAHLSAGGEQQTLRLNLSWMGKGQSWRIVRAITEAADGAEAAVEQARQSITDLRAQLVDTQSHIGRPFEQHAELEAARERKTFLEMAVREGAASAGKQASDSAPFDTSPGREMTEAEMALHDARAMVGELGGSAMVLSGDDLVGLIQSLPDNDRSRDPAQGGDAAGQQRQLGAEPPTPPAVDDQPGPGEEPAPAAAAAEQQGVPSAPPEESVAGAQPAAVEPPTAGEIAALLVTAAGTDPGLAQAARVNDLDNFQLVFREFADDLVAGSDSEQLVGVYFAQDGRDRQVALQEAGPLSYQALREQQSIVPAEETGRAEAAPGEGPVEPVVSTGPDVVYTAGPDVQVGEPAAAPTADAGQSGVQPEPVAAPVADAPPPEPATPEAEAPAGPPPDAIAVPGAEDGYLYATADRTVTLFGPSGEEVGSARWSFVQYRYEGTVQGDTVRGTDDEVTVAQRMARHHAVVYGNQVHRPELDAQGRDPVWVLHNGADSLVFGIRPGDTTAQAAMWAAGGWKGSRRIGAWYLPRTWKEETRRGRVETAVRVLAAAGRTVETHRDRGDRSAAERSEPAALAVLAVAAPDLAVPQLGPAEPYAVEVELSTDMEALRDAYGRWEQIPTVRLYIDQDRRSRPNGFGSPDNAIAELDIAYNRVATMRPADAGGPDRVLSNFYAVAAWSAVLAPAVEEELRGPLREVAVVALRLTARFQAAADAVRAQAATREQTIVEVEPEQREAADEGVRVEPAVSSRTEAGPVVAGSSDPSQPQATAEGVDLPDHSEGVTPEAAGAEQAPAEERGAPGALTEPGVDEVEGTADEAPGQLIGGRFEFGEPVTDVDEQGWYVLSDAPDGAVYVQRDGTVVSYQPDQLTSARRPVAEPASDAPAEGAVEAPGVGVEPVQEDLFSAADVDQSPSSAAELEQSAVEPEQIQLGDSSGQGAVGDVADGPVSTPTGEGASAADDEQVKDAADALPVDAPSPAPADESPVPDAVEAPDGQLDLFATASTEDAAPGEQRALPEERTVPEPEPSQELTVDQPVAVAEPDPAVEPTAAGPIAPTVQPDEALPAEDAGAEDAAVPPYEDGREQELETYVRTGRVPAAYTSLDEWLGTDADGMRAMREEYLEALIEEHDTPVEPPAQPPALTQPLDVPAADQGSVEATASEAPSDPVTTTTEPIQHDEPTPEPTTMTEQTQEAPAAAPAGETAPPQMDELPLSAADNSGATPVEPDVVVPEAPETPAPAESVGSLAEELAGVMEAWAENVPADHGSADDLRATLETDLQTLQGRWSRTDSPQVPAPAAEPGHSAGEPSGQSEPPTAAEAVSSALQRTDERSASLQGVPEWQEIQTVRGAARHLLSTLRERAGEYADRLFSDVRVQGFVRAVSIRTFESISGLAQAAADRLRRSPAELPSAEALLALGNSAGAYSVAQRRSGLGGLPSAEALLTMGNGPASAGAGQERPGGPAATNEVNVASLQKMGEALRKPLPGQKPAATMGVSAAAARSRSTTRKTPTKKPAAGAGEQAKHLRRPAADTQQGRKPNQR